MVNGNDGNVTGPVGPEILDWLLDRHAASLELYARQLCDCAEDVVQEALIELADQAETPGDVVAWLYRVVRNKALNASRSARRRRRREAKAASKKPTWFAASAADPIDAQAAAAALEALPGEEREVVVAHIWGGLSFQQIGQLIGTSDSTAHRRYQAALSQLRDKLGVPCPKKS